MGKERNLLRIEEVAELLDCGRDSIFRLIKDGLLLSLKIGRSRRIRRAEVERFLSEGERKGLGTS